MALLVTRLHCPGDPLNPYLFLLCADGFSTILNEARELRLMRGVRIKRSTLSINHLFFADDSLLFGDVTKEGAERVQGLYSFL